MQRQDDVDMTFDSFVQLYEKNKKPKLKLNISLVQDRCDRCAGCRRLAAFGRAAEKKAPEQTALSNTACSGEKRGTPHRKTIGRPKSQPCLYDPNFESCAKAAKPFERLVGITAAEQS